MLVLGFVTAFAPVGVGASAATDEACKLDPNSALCKDKSATAVPKFIKTLVNVLLYVLGAVSVVVIIFAGIFYATSGGDTALVTKAKNTLLYAVVGLIVAIMAYAIVNFVLTQFKGIV
jgi:hypothetical protein